MNVVKSRAFLRTAGLAAVLVASSGWAGAHAPKGDNEAQARFREDRAACMSGASNQDRQTCMREAQAALAESRRGSLSTGASSDDFRANAMARCDVQPERDRADCKAMARGEGTASGSVGQGAIVREHVRRVPAKRASEHGMKKHHSAMPHAAPASGPK